MDAIERIKNAMKKNNGEPLWPYGLNREAPKETIAAWGLLTDLERLTVSKYNPAKTLRNSMVRTLFENFGFNQKIICVISGLSRSSVSRLLSDEHRNFYKKSK